LELQRFRSIHYLLIDLERVDFDFIQVWRFITLSGIKFNNFLSLFLAAGLRVGVISMFSTPSTEVVELGNSQTFDGNLG